MMTTPDETAAAINAPAADERPPDAAQEMPPTFYAKIKNKLKFAKDHILEIGGFLGALTAIVTLPAVGHSIWKNGFELKDRVTDPDISMSADLFSVRCAVKQFPASGQILTLEQNCDPGAFAVSMLVTLVNEDFVPRNLHRVSMIVTLVQPDGQTDERVLDRARLVRHETINGRDSVVWSAWQSISLGPQASTVQELLFSSKSAGVESYGAFRKAMYTPGVAPKWTKVRLKIQGKFVGDDKTFELGTCSNDFNPDFIAKRLADPSKQNQITLKCRKLGKKSAGNG